MKILNKGQIRWRYHFHQKRQQSFLNKQRIILSIFAKFCKRFENQLQFSCQSCFFLFVVLYKRVLRLELIKGESWSGRCFKVFVYANMPDSDKASSYDSKFQLLSLSKEWSRKISTLVLSWWMSMITWPNNSSRLNCSCTSKGTFFHSWTTTVTLLNISLSLGILQWWGLLYGILWDILNFIQCLGIDNPFKEFFDIGEFFNKLIEIILDKVGSLWKVRDIFLILYSNYKRMKLNTWCLGVVSALPGLETFPQSNKIRVKNEIYERNDNLFWLNSS